MVIPHVILLLKGDKIQIKRNMTSAQDNKRIKLEEELFFADNNNNNKMIDDITKNPDGQTFIFKCEASDSLSMMDTSPETELSDDSYTHLTLAEQLRKWFYENDITRSSLSELLVILRAHGHTELPIDAETLLNTPSREEVVDTVNNRDEDNTDSERLIEERSTINTSSSDSIFQELKDLLEKDEFPLPQAEFQRIIIEALSSIVELLSPSRYDVIEAAPVKCTSVAELIEFDSLLANDKVEFLKLVKYWTSPVIGGENVRKSIIQMLASITDNKVLSEMNWDGQGGKTGFKILPKTFEALKISALKRHKTDVKEVKKHLQSVLKYAPHKKGGLKHKSYQNTSSRSRYQTDVFFD